MRIALKFGLDERPSLVENERKILMKFVKGLHPDDGPNFHQKEQWITALFNHLDPLHAFALITKLWLMQKEKSKMPGFSSISWVNLDLTI